MTAKTKLNKIVLALEEGRTPRGLKNISLYDIRTLQEINDILKSKKSADTINSNVKEICLSCGLTVKEKGIGWSITA